MSVLEQFAEDVKADAGLVDEPQQFGNSWIQIILDMLIPLLQDCFQSGPQLQEFARRGPNRIQSAQLYGCCRNQVQAERGVGPFVAARPARQMRDAVVKQLRVRATTPNGGNVGSDGADIWESAVNEARPQR